MVSQNDSMDYAKPPMNDLLFEKIAPPESFESQELREAVRQVLVSFPRVTVKDAAGETILPSSVSRRLNEVREEYEHLLEVRHWQQVTCAGPQEFIDLMLRLQKIFLNAGDEEFKSKSEKEI